jgi:hypothetical protein
MSDLPTLFRLDPEREDWEQYWNPEMNIFDGWLVAVDERLMSAAEWRDSLDYERFARWLYNFTSPTGPMSVVSWEGLPQVRRDQWMDRIRHGLDDKLGLGEQP